MKRMGNSPVFWVCLAATLFSGCSQKKPVAAVPQPAPPSATAPPAESQPTPAETQTQTQESQPATQGTPPPDTQPAEPASEKPDSTKAKSGKSHSNGKKPTSETARNIPPKTVVKPDGAEPAPSAGQISPSLSHADVAHDQATTEQLLQNTEATLNGIKRQLSQDEQATVAQIRDYMNQSRQATKANDLTRAYNLAMKARLLSDDLAKRR